MATEVLNKLTPIFRDVLDIPDLELSDSLSARDVPEWDSLNHIRIIAAAEKHFNVRLASSEIEKLQNVGQFAALIASKL